MGSLKSCDTPESYVKTIAREFPNSSYLYTSRIDVSFQDVGRRGDHRYEFTAEFSTMGKIFALYKAYQSTDDEALTDQEQKESVAEYVKGLEKVFQDRYLGISLNFDPQKCRITFN
ncbi:hypothetical protein FJZ18_02165 [Candidatus Pacearchaeota archaeon]|nr:hypothetical protein [Candidatus Pacearchaeota archaeon]